MTVLLACSYAVAASVMSNAIDPRDEPLGSCIEHSLPTLSGRGRRSSWMWASVGKRSHGAQHGCRLRDHDRPRGQTFVRQTQLQA